MRLLANPAVMRMAVLLAGGAFTMIMARLMMRRIRRTLVEDSPTVEKSSSQESFPLHTYHAVIQQLKQQKHELLSMQQVERRRAETVENISATVLSNLSSGVMFVATNGLVRQANGAAKQILGFASPVGMSLKEVFRDAVVLSRSAPHETLAQRLQQMLKQKTPSQRLEGHYVTPAHDERILDITLSSVLAPNGDVLGLACLLTDQTEMARINREYEIRREISSEMALTLRNSLTTISGYAAQLAASNDAASVRQLATDIAEETALLDHTVGGFLAGTRASAAAGM
ncbi:MAG: PAS domain-containing protein [Acidobacteriales bacterium]|nr:PAS domain-containing protein [Terriglobales bacterium]